MEFYDIVLEGCTFDINLASKLGFKNVFAINREIRAVGHGNEIDNNMANTIAFGKASAQLIALAKRGATAVCITDSYIDKKLIETMKASGSFLCLSMSTLTASSGNERSKNAFRMSKLFAYARKSKIEVAFASMAKTPLHMNSYMQLIALAGMVGADEEYARFSISQINRTIGAKK